MSVDILYYSDNNFSFQTLNELMYRLQTTLKEKIYLMYYDNFEKKTYWSFDSNSFNQISNIDSCKNLYKYKLEIIDYKNLIQDFSQNIYELLHKNKIRRKNEKYQKTREKRAASHLHVALHARRCARLQRLHLKQDRR